MEINIVSVIQSMLAPGIMVSACGLLLLSINNKYSMVVSRIRVLDDEIRNYKHTLLSEKLYDDQKDRYESIISQIVKLNYRVLMIRNAVISYYLAVALFILTCLIIGLGYALQMERVYYLTVVMFLIGMLSVLAGVIYSAKETVKGYEIISIEIQDTIKIK